MQHQKVRLNARALSVTPADNYVHQSGDALSKWYDERTRMESASPVIPVAANGQL
jgi:hypothetical protein